MVTEAVSLLLEGTKKWDYDSCYNAAKQYKSKFDFQKNIPSAYNAARKHGWLSDYIWFESNKKPDGYWNRQTCYDEAKKYTTRNEFRKKSQFAYNVARKNGWLDDYTWFVELHKPNGYWDYDKCKEEANKYTSKVDFKKKSPSAYNVALKNNWIKDYNWFERPQAHNKKWDYDSCYNEAKKYTRKVDFRNNGGTAYNVALKNGWLKDYTWFESNRKPDGYWNEQTCREEALKYRTLHDFRQNAPTAFSVSWKNGWVSSYNWFVRKGVPETNCYIVYSYRDDENKTIYIGLTNSPKNRHRQHVKGITKNGQVRYSAVYNYFTSIGADIPNPVVLKQDLYANEAQAWEDYYVKHFKEEGWNVLNTAKTGGLGSLSSSWTKEKCYNAALECKSRIDFKTKYERAYRVAVQNKWIDDYTWFETNRKPDGYWTYEKCYDEAKKYETRTQFQKNSNAAYTAAWRNGWMDNFTWFVEKQKPNGYWTYEKCYDEAKKYSSASEFSKKDSAAANAAYKNGWMKDYTWFKRPEAHNKKWTYEKCYNEAKKYSSRGELNKYARGAYKVALKNGWLDDYTWFKQPQKANE